MAWARSDREVISSTKAGQDALGRDVSLSKEPFTAETKEADVKNSDEGSTENEGLTFEEKQEDGRQDGAPGTLEEESTGKKRKRLSLHIEWEDLTDISEQEIRPDPIIKKAAVFVGSNRIIAEADRSLEYVSDICQEPLRKQLVLKAGNASYTYSYGELGLTWTNQEILEMIGQAVSDPFFKLSNISLCFSPTYDVNPDILHSVLDPLIRNACVSPINGSVIMIRNHPEVTSGINGIRYDEEIIFPELAKLILTPDAPEEYVLKGELIRPDFCRDTVSFDSEPLGEYTTYNLGVPGRIHNIERSASGINGTLIMPGERLSALTMYGNVTQENGYEVAPVYNTGRQIPGIGGGICQTTTTLYNAVLRAELQVVFRRQHSMLVNYVPPSFDAMVDYGTHSDFIAENNTGYPIYLQASTGIDSDGDTYVNVTIWGTDTRPENREVSFDFEVLYVRFPYVLFSENLINDDMTTYGLVMPNEKIYAEVECHPFVQSRAFKTVKIDGVVQSVEQLPATYGSYDQYKEMPGVIYHASDCLVTYWVVEDPDTWLGQRIHYQVMFKNGEGWDPNDPNHYYWY